jgi:hypothetical protein
MPCMMIRLAIAASDTYIYSVKTIFTNTHPNRHLYNNSTTARHQSKNLHINRI